MVEASAKISYMVATMNGRAVANAGLMARTNAVFINQVVRENANRSPPADGRWHDFYEIGLSRSRNRAIFEVARSEIVVLTDDDVALEPDSDEIILGAFTEHPDADVIAFMVRSLDGKTPFKSYPTTARWLDERTVARVSSIEMALRAGRVRSAGVRFDERFGLGGFYPSGEEYIFLVDCLRRGLKVLFVPKFIVRHPLESTGRKWSEELMRGKGAMLRRVFPWTWPVYAAAFIVKKARAHNKLLRPRMVVAMIFGALSFVRVSRGRDEI